MDYRKLILTVALMGVVGVGSYYFFQGQTIADTGEDAQVVKQFLEERGQGSTEAITGTSTINGQAAGRPSVFGTVEQIDGNKMTVNSIASGGSVEIQIADGAQIEKMVEGAFSDITPGRQILAVGSKTDEGLEATSIQLVDDEGTTGQRGIMRSGTGDDASDQSRPESVLGVVETAGGDQVTVKTQTGDTTTVTLATGGTVQKLVDIQLSDIHIGDAVTGVGSQQGESFQATRIQVGGMAGFRTQSP